jgi:hypothetical protein
MIRIEMETQDCFVSNYSWRSPTWHMHVVGLFQSYLHADEDVPLPNQASKFRTSYHDVEGRWWQGEEILQQFVMP